MSDFLPGDVLSDIFTTLPLKTLIRCNCVCKSWYSLLTSPSFITKHLNRSRSNNNEFLLVRSYTDFDNQEHFSLRYDDNEMFSEYAQLNFPLKSYCLNNYFRLIGSCNGLICLSDDRITYVYNIFLWNPYIRKIMPLPPFRVTLRSHGPFMHTVGFGFDSITDDYKVIRIVRLEEFYDYTNPPEIDIFSLSTVTWRNISHVALPRIIIHEKASQAFLNGAAHWIASSSSAGSHSTLIVSFHMGHEEFGKIMMPKNITPHAAILCFGDFHVTKFQESLALIHGYQPCCIWVMKEYGLAESWTKLFNIDTNGPFKSVAGFTRKGKILFATSFGHLVAHDPQAGLLTHVLFRGSTKYRHSFYADAYTQSLVLIGKGFSDPNNRFLTGRK